jgi:hypothetical protein
VRDQKQRERDAVALVFHDMRSQQDGVTALLDSYEVPDASDLTFGFVRLALDFADIVSSERHESTSSPIDSAGRTLDEEARPAVALAQAFAAQDAEGATRLVRDHEGPSIDFVIGLVDLVQAILKEIADLGGEPVRFGDSTKSLEERWLQDYAYWIATDEPPNKGYTYHRDDPRPCYVCGRLAFGREPEVRPHHIGCVPPAD